MLNRSNYIRLDSLDLAKGLLMVIMALDHASALAGNLHWSEYWGSALPDYANSVAYFLTRFITHLCAPGFFFFMGAGVALLAARWTAAGRHHGDISRHFLVRGVLLLVIQQCIENPAWLLGFITVPPEDLRGHFGSPGDTLPIYLHFGVLTALGVALILSGWLHRLGSTSLTCLGIFLLTLAQWQTPGVADVDKAFPFWQQFLLVAGHGDHVNVMYPVIPWLGISCLGMVFGKRLLAKPHGTLRQGAWLGVALLALFTGLQLAPFGDSTRVVTGSVIGFLTTTKYPPSSEFVVLTLGLNLIVVAGLHRFSEQPGAVLQRVFGPLRLFGRNALFFYVVHLYVYALMGLALPPGLNLGQIYLVWFIGLIPMYFLCRAYLGFASSRSKLSVWRYF